MTEKNDKKSLYGVVWGLSNFRMIIVGTEPNPYAMTTRNASSSSTILVAIILIITFPIWFSIGATLFGVAAGIFGALVGVMAAIFGVMIAIIAIPFKLLFGWGHGDLDWQWFPHFHYNGFFMLAIILIAFLIVRRKK